VSLRGPEVDVDAMARRIGLRFAAVQAIGIAVLAALILLK
jgi:hypothetical protein